MFTSGQKLVFNSAKEIMIPFMSSLLVFLCKKVFFFLSFVDISNWKAFKVFKAYVLCDGVILLFLFIRLKF